jgi:LPXTG-motif cell wall-anchored protein
LRRAAFVVLAMLAGTLAALIGASPASAHFSSVSGTATCDSDTGNWVVTWTVTVHATQLTGHLFKVVATPTPVDGIDVGTDVPFPDGVTGTQLVPNGSATVATLAVRAQWDDYFKDAKDRVGQVTLGTNCIQDQPKPTASASSACDGSVTLDLSNTEGTKAAIFAVTLGNHAPVDHTVAKGTDEKVVVDGVDAGSIIVKSGGVTLLTTKWTPPADCAPLAVSSKSDCTSLTVILDNPAGNKAVDVTVTSGNQQAAITVGNGETQQVTFPATAGTTATVTFDLLPAVATHAAGDTTPITVAWEQPAACLATTAPPAPPVLPTTGSHLTPVIATGGGLLVVGAAVLFLLYRRRHATQRPTF